MHMVLRQSDYRILDKIASMLSIVLCRLDVSCGSFRRHLANSFKIKIKIKIKYEKKKKKKKKKNLQQGHTTRKYILLKVTGI
jgi:hypothetical protein